jgi:hypothetical protein
MLAIKNIEIKALALICRECQIGINSLNYLEK